MVCVCGRAVSLEAAGTFFERNGRRFVLLRSYEFKTAVGWHVNNPMEKPNEEICLVGWGGKAPTTEVKLPAGKYYVYVRSKMVTARTYEQNKSVRSSAPGAGVRISIDNTTCDKIFGQKPLLMEKTRGRPMLLPNDRFYRWEKSVRSIKIRRDGIYTLQISRVKPQSQTPSQVVAILLTNEVLHHLPERDMTARRMWRSLHRVNSVTLYRIPKKLFIKETARAIKYRGGDNFGLGLFYADGYQAQPWEYYSFREFPEMFKDDPGIKKKLQAGVRRNLNALREKIARKKKKYKCVIANANLIHLPYWARERFFKCYPDCNPRYMRQYLRKQGFDPKYPIHLCALSEEAEKLTVGMVDELFANVPLDGLMLTIGDNSGQWKCRNKEHKHYKEYLNRRQKIKASRKKPSGVNAGAVDWHYYDMEYAEKAMLNIIKWTYTGMKKHRRKPLLMLRAWSGPGLFLMNESRRDAFVEKIYKIVPKEDFFIVSKHSAPPSWDYCWRPAAYSPIFSQKSVQKFAILGWGESQGSKSIVPVSIWYDCPDIIQRDIKKLAALGMMVANGIGYGDSYPEQELTHVAGGCLLRDPQLDLDALKKRWAKYRYGKKAGAHVLAAIQYGPKVLEKHTLYHEGREQMDSIHFLSVSGKTRYRQQRAVPPWLKTVNKGNYAKLQQRLDATADAMAMLKEIKAAQKLRPNDEMIEICARKAQATVHLAGWFRDFHHAYLHRRMYFELKDKDRDAALTHVRQGLELYKSAFVELDKYACTSPPFGMLGDFYNKMLKATRGWQKKMQNIAKK